MIKKYFTHNKGNEIFFTNLRIYYKVSGSVNMIVIIKIEKYLFVLLKM